MDDTLDMTESGLMLLLPPGPSCSQTEVFDFLHQQLDSFGTDQPAFEDLVLLGGGKEERMQGGAFLYDCATNLIT